MFFLGKVLWSAFKAEALQRVFFRNVSNPAFLAKPCDISESAAKVRDSDSEWNNVNADDGFFGDFWETEMSANKIILARGEIQLLLEKINHVNEFFLDILDNTESAIESHVNEIWDETINTQ